MDNLSAKMVELFQGVFVIPGNTNVGVIVDKNNNINELYLVDSGSTEIDGEFVLDVLEAYFEQINEQFKIKAIISTHCHADHCGGHNYIKDETECEIWAAFEERSSMENPIIQSEFLWGGYPPHELMTVFFKPSPTYVDKTINDEETISISDDRVISFISLNGHSYHSLGIIITDKKGNKILFSGDAIFPRNEIAKFWVPLIANPAQFMDSLDDIGEIKDLKWCIPSHGDFISRNLAETIELNKISILSNRMCILEALDSHEKLTMEEIIKYLADKNTLELSFAQYCLLSATVKSYVSVMHDAKEIKMKIENNILYFMKNKMPKSN